MKWDKLKIMKERRGRPKPFFGAGVALCFQPESQERKALSFGEGDRARF